MQLIQFLLVLSLVLTLLFAIHLFVVQAGNLFLNRMLAFFFISRFTENLLQMLFYNNQLPSFPYLIKALLPLSYLSPGLLYLYIRGFIEDRIGFTKKDLIHLIPLVVALVDTMGIFAYSRPELQQLVNQIKLGKSLLYKERIGLFSGLESISIRQALHLIYFFLIGKLMVKNKIFSTASRDSIESRWIILLSVGILLSQIIRFLSVVLTGSTGSLSSAILTIVGVAGIVIIGIIILYLLYNPKILYGFIFVGRSEKEASVNSTIANLSSSPVAVEKKSRNASEEEVQATLSLIEKFMVEKKPFLRHNCRISYIAETLDMPVHHCSYIINMKLNKNFRDWLNSYRIVYFIESFPLKSDKMTIEALAAEAGFSSAATFYSAFKKEMGTSPTSYFKDNSGKF